MTLPGAQALYGVVSATWPAHALHRLGPWTLREGRGGGKRASAATAESVVGAADLADAEAAMRATGQRPLFMVREGDDALDTLLAGEGYQVIDPVVMYATPLGDLSMDTPAPTASFHVWEPLAIQREIWAEGGITPARITVMERVSAPKTALMGRRDGHAAAAGFAAIHAGTVMVHALEVRAGYRRQGVGHALMLEAARWAIDQRARHLAVVCTEANTAARALYARMGLAEVAHYHYRQHPEGTA